MCAPRGTAQGYRHEAVLYRDMDGYADALVPFVLDGVRAGQPVLVAVPGGHLDRLRTELRGVAGVDFLDMAELGANPARILPAWLAFIDDHADGCTALRGIGEPIWAGRRAAELTECHLHESLLNRAVDPRIPLWLRCPYDTSALEPAALTQARRNHPWLVEDEVTTTSGEHRELDEPLSDWQPLPEPSAPVRSLIFGAGFERVVRDRVADAALDAGVDPERAADLLLAVHELAVNSVVHGGGTGRLRLWLDAGALMCEIGDRGWIRDPLVGRRTPDLSGEGGRGLWMVHQLVDLVQIRSSTQGTTVRLHTWTAQPLAS